MHRARNQDAVGLRQRLQPCSDVHTIAIDVAAVNDDVADVDADAEFDPPIGRHVRIALCHAALDVNRATHCIDHTDEFDKDAVAGRLDDATAVLGDLGVDQFLADALELAERAFLVQAHQPAVTGNVARKNCGQSTFDFFF